MFKQSKRALAVAMGLLVSSGCAMDSIIERSANTPPERETQATVMVDQAMQLRNWDRSTAYYGNGNVVAGPTGFWYQPARDQSEWRYAIEETPLFVVQTIALPVTLVVTPPWTPVMYSGVTVPPTYHGLPPLPPGSGSTMARDVMPAPVQP